MKSKLTAPEDKDLMLTTMDNPFNPKENYDQWRNWDIANHYHTESLLARVVEIPEDADEFTIQEAIKMGMLSILEDDVTHTYRLI